MYYKMPVHDPRTNVPYIISITDLGSNLMVIKYINGHFRYNLGVLLNQLCLGYHHAMSKGLYFFSLSEIPCTGNA